MKESKWTLLVVVLLLIPVGAMISGFFMMHLWNMLLVPTFEISPLSYIHAIALAVFVGYFRQGLEPRQEPTLSNLIDSLVSSIIMSCLYLGVAFGITLFF